MAELSVEEKAEKALCTRLRSALRRLWMFYGINRKECLSKGKRDYTGENKRQKCEYKCEGCKEWFPGKNIKVDHITPCGSFLTVNQGADWMVRLFDGEVQLLCKACHDQKSAKEKRRKK